VRRLALLIVGGAVWLLLAAPAFADNGPHHMGAGTTPDSCAGCHRAHTAQGPNLLKESDQSLLCTTCHGNGITGATTNVLSGQQSFAADGTTKPGAVTTVTRGTTIAGPLRGGGFDTAALNTNPTANLVTDPIGVLASPLGTTAKHNVAASGTAWGGGAIGSGAGTAVRLECASCHDPHGNGQYRILKTQPDGLFGTASVSIADVTPVTGQYVYTTANYWAAGDTNAPQYITNVSAWCQQCHSRYMATSNLSPETNTSGDAIFTFRHRTDGVTSQPASKVAPACVTCHVSHGSNAQMGGNSAAVLYPDGSARTNSEGAMLRLDSRGVCQKCHAK
jgi:predicted CXXCH cytochrome family protein